MVHTIHDLGQGFWTIRGDFRIAGVLNVGTQAGLVQLRSGRFVMLDSYPLSGAVREAVMKLTDQGRAVQAVLNLHPFHTLHCATTAKDFPTAKLYGSQRHQRLHPDLAWQPDLVESQKVQDMFADDLTLSLPRGIDYISGNESVHAGSLLAWHPNSRTLHVDDTICLLTAPNALKLIIQDTKIFLHPTMPKALLPQAEAVIMLEEWINQLSQMTANLRWLCAAHSGHIEYKIPNDFSNQLLTAFQRIKPKLTKTKTTT